MAASKANFFTQKFKEISIITAVAIVAASLIFYFKPFGSSDQRPNIPKYLILETNYKQAYSNIARTPTGERFASAIVYQNTSFSTSQNIEEAKAWYKQQLLAHGWQILDESSFNASSGTIGSQLFAMDQYKKYSLNLFIDPQSDQQNSGSYVTLGYRRTLSNNQ